MLAYVINIMVVLIIFPIIPQTDIKDHSYQLTQVSVFHLNLSQFSLYFAKLSTMSLWKPTLQKLNFLNRTELSLLTNGRPR